MFKTALLVLLIALSSGSLFAQSETGEMPPATSDGCSLFPDGNYRDCCVEHDKDYYKGGSCRERSESDKRLYRCVKSKKGWQNKIIAPIIWIGVRIGGVSFLPTPFRWGFGKKKKRATKTPEVQKPVESPKTFEKESETKKKDPPKTVSPTPVTNPEAKKKRLTRSRSK